MKGRSAAMERVENVDSRAARGHMSMLCVLCVLWPTQAQPREKAHHELFWGFQSGKTTT